MKVFSHHIYEYKKGLRNLVLHTMNTSELDLVEARLNRDNIAYHVQHVTNSKINVFFGRNECVEIIKHFTNESLSKLTPEQDFILGIMLGYDRIQQCERYTTRKHNNLVKLVS